MTFGSRSAQLKKTTSPSRAGAPSWSTAVFATSPTIAARAFSARSANPPRDAAAAKRRVAYRDTPWVDWSNYWGTGDASSKSDRNVSGSHLLDRNIRGVDGALLDLEYQRMELIRFNLFDNATYETYLTAEDGPIREVWPEMRLTPDDPAYGLLRIAEDGSQLCQGDLIRFRTHDRHLQRHPEPGDGIDRAALHPQRRFRVDQSRARPRPAREEPPRRTASRCSSPTRR